MKKLLTFFTFVVLLTSCTLTIGDTHNCSGQCCGNTEECSISKDSTVTEETTNEIPNNNEYQVVEE